MAGVDAAGTQDGAAIRANWNLDLDLGADVSAQERLSEGRLCRDAPVFDRRFAGVDDDVRLLGAVIEADRDGVAEFDDAWVVWSILDGVKHDRGDP